MVFFTLIIIAIGLYIRGYKISALFLFFFFLTSGFNLIPEDVMKNRFFSKGMDYAILTIAGIVIIDGFFIKNYFKPDKLYWLILIFYAFLASCIIYNRYVVGVGWEEIIRTARYNVLWIAYLVFRNLSKEQLLYLLKCLFLATVICSILYLLQIILNEHILIETFKTSTRIFGIKVPRFHNHPNMLHIFTFMAIYFNPYKGSIKIITTILLILALLGAFHRNLFIAFVLAISIGYIICLPRVKKITALISIGVFSLFFIIFWGYKFVNSRTINDISIVLSGNVSFANIEDIDTEELQKSTFAFRIAHLLERNQYVLEHPKAMLFGAGLMAEDSKITDSMFDFGIGLFDEKSEGKTIQLDTGDISYSILILRYGYLGTLFVLSLYLFLMYYSYKNRKDPVGLFSFVYFIAVIVVSFFSYILILPVTFLIPLITYCLIQKNKEEYETISKTLFEDY